MRITLCIPTRNRSEFLGRLLCYYATTRFPHRISIGDASGPEEAARNQQAIDSFRDALTIEYWESPGLSSGAALERMSQSISTPYCAFLGDDDFLCPGMLERCMEFLDAHPDYGSAHGNAILFQLEQPGPYGELGTVHHYPQAVLEAETGAERLREFFTVSLYAVLNSVHRAETWRAMFQGLGAMSGVMNRNLFKDELIATCVSVVRGKVKALDGLSLIRQAHETYHWPHVYDWLTDPEWFPSYQVFVERVSDELMRQDGLGPERARAEVREALWVYLAHEVTRAWRKEVSPRGPKRLRLRAFAKRIPGLRTSWRALRAMGERQRDAFSLPALVHPSSPYHAEFMPAYRVLSGARPDQIPRGVDGDRPADITLAGVAASMEPGE